MRFISLLYICSMEKERKEVVLAEVGKFFIDEEYTASNDPERDTSFKSKMSMF